MRLILVFIFVCNITLSLAQINEVKTSKNEITSKSDNWKINDKTELHSQIILLKNTISNSERSLPTIIWFKNNAKKVKWIKSIAPVFSLHGNAKILNSKNENILELRCLKKHVYQSIPISTNEIKGFYCDLFSQRCVATNFDKLKEGRYKVIINNSNIVELLVVKSNF